MRYTINLIFCLLVQSFVFAGEPASGISAEQWKMDLDYFEREFAGTHKNPFGKMSEKDFRSAVQNLRNRAGSLDQTEMAVEISRIVAMAGDGHTLVPLGDPSLGFHLIPVRMYFFPEGLYVLQTAEEYKNAIGGKIVMIGNLKTEEAYKKVREVISRDNEMTVLNTAPVALACPEVLTALNITESKETVPLLIEKNGKQFTMDFKPRKADRDPLSPHPDWPELFQKTTTKPLWLRQPSTHFWYEFLPAEKLLYVQFNAVANSEKQTVADFFAEVFEFVEKKPVEKFVLDLRWNGGGNNTLNKPIMLGIVRNQKINQKGKLFALIGRQTFSAAQNCVNLLEKFTNVTFIGEPTGASPNHYGDAARITLPHSKIHLQASTLWWQDMDPRDAREWTPPEIAAELTFADYAAGKDPALDAVRGYTPEKPLFDVLLDLLKIDRLEEAEKAYSGYRTAPKHKFANTESEINRLGYTLLGQKKYRAAISVFEWNARDNPHSWNAYDSLAEGLAEAGETKRAIEFYRKALELNPKSKPSREALDRLLKNKN